MSVYSQSLPNTAYNISQSNALDVSLNCTSSKYGFPLNTILSNVTVPLVAVNMLVPLDIPMDPSLVLISIVEVESTSRTQSFGSIRANYNSYGQVYPLAAYSMSIRFLLDTSSILLAYEARFFPYGAYVSMYQTLSDIIGTYESKLIAPPQTSADV